ncbi:MAG: ACT domain-containing protein [Acidobacteria bacterium]|nr:ACT domain-containing protein [Acidobacteriota bacterium]MCI0620459.1 ACT domain-containing protein [Acidobacteriota bacterium]MCI0717888.1 ACT domain-containing protein [Acidobacteriota bacterium]
MPLALTLTILAECFAVARLDENTPFPQWASSGGWWSVTKTDDELSIVCPEEQVPANVMVSRGWKCLKVSGPLDFNLTGILSSLVNPLAEAQISVFALSTYDTDYLLVKAENLERALRVLSFAGHQVLSAQTREL